jgi:hypothetical protein
VLQWRCRGSHRLVWAAAGGLAAAAMGGYVLTRTVGGFLGDHGDVGNWRCPLGLAALRAVTIDPAGQVAGTLATGQPFTTTIPVALDDRVLAGRLAVHHVQVTATGARDLLTSHTDTLNQLTAALLEHETISGDQVRALVHPGAPGRGTRSVNGPIVAPVLPSAGLFPRLSPLPARLAGLGRRSVRR